MVNIGSAAKIFGGRPNIPKRITMTRLINLDDLIGLPEEELRQRIHTISPDDIIGQIRSAQNIEQIAWIIGMIDHFNYPYLQQVLGKLDHGAIFERLYGERNLSSVSFLIETLHKAGFIGLNDLDPAKLIECIRSSANIIGAKRLINTLAEIEYKHLQEILKEMDLVVLNQHISEVVWDELPYKRY